MNMTDVAKRGLVWLGCGKMGSAMLEGWLRTGLPPLSVTVIDPNPSGWLKEQGVQIGGKLPTNPAVAIIAVKPQMMGAALPDVKALGNGDTLIISIAAGTPIATFEDALGKDTPIIRAMPNTPAAIGRGITAIVGNDKVASDQIDLAEGLLLSVGDVVRLDSEDQMDVVTAVSGSGPAYVFHLIETLAAAGMAEGLPADLAMQLAKATVAGAGELAQNDEVNPAQLRANVTSPNGTTEAALKILMDFETGFPPLLRRAVAAAAKRSRELADG